ncbi:hypothetical protein SNEBB_004333 [Seison nebaliae]|nr:hypothetical protein SNEBB_004333 [Seison nebaliae]
MNHKSFSIQVGMKNLNERNKYRRTVRVIAVATTPGLVLSSTQTSEDIALLKLECALPFVSSVPNRGELMPACFPKTTMEFQKETCWASGWGANRGGGPVQQDLHKAKITLLSTYYCNQNDKRKDKICNSFRQTNTGTCQGDSGGPISCKVGSQFYVAGVVSFSRYKVGGPVCRGENFYTKVSLYRRWVMDTARKWGV